MTASPKTQALEALIEAHATELKLPTVKRRFRQLAAEVLARELGMGGDDLARLIERGRRYQGVDPDASRLLRCGSMFKDALKDLVEHQLAPRGVPPVVLLDLIGTPQ